MLAFSVAPKLLQVQRLQRPQIPLITGCGNGVDPLAVRLDQLSTEPGVNEARIFRQAAEILVLVLDTQMLTPFSRDCAPQGPDTAYFTTT